MVLTVRNAIQAIPLEEPARTHALLLARRLVANRGLDADVDDADAWTAGLEYLAVRVQSPDMEALPIAERHGLPPWRLMRVLDALREGTEYRAYVGEWIRDGCPVYEGPLQAEEEVEPELEFELEPIQLDVLEELEEELEPVPPATALRPAPKVVLPIGPVDAEVPTRWQAPFLPYAWQRDAAMAWEQNNGRGIMQVVTGAGKTALSLFLYARLVDRLEAIGHELQLIVVVPRIELARQWAREIRQILNLRGLRLGQYHSESKCRPRQQDILIITQDSARNVLPQMRFDRPVLLVADECHRLGAPGASRILERDYTWTLGLSATPERGGDSGFEQILIPRLGPVIWKYGYTQAVRDGIIARFTVLRAKVEFSPAERAAYDERSEKIKRLMDALKASYPVLRRTPPVRFWQVMGDLKNHNKDDARFDMWQAATSERRDVVHFAEEKLGVVQSIAQRVGAPRRVLCFHERIEAAEKLKGIIAGCGRKVTVFHSQVPEPGRTANLARFRDGTADWLVACKSLDEGLDIPAVDTIVIAASTKAPRQLIQRLGRALRRKGEDRLATVILVEVAGVDDAMLDHEGLAELREAAEAVREISPDELIAWLTGASTVEVKAAVGRMSVPAVPVLPSERRPPRPEVHPRPTAKPAPSAPPAEAKDDPGLLRRMWRSIVPRSWTGTQGNQSYYDKDSSPD